MADKTVTTKYQLDLMCHALGLRQKGDQSHRNYFAADPGSKDYEEWVLLVKSGLAECFGSKPQIFGSLVGFSVTDAGRVEATKSLPEPPKLSRSRKRYLLFLGLDLDIKYGEWLKDKYYNEYRCSHGC